MKVQCIHLVNPISGDPESRSPWLTVGKEYLVLAVSVLPERGVMFRIVADDGHSPMLFKARQFAVTVTDVPSIWKVRGDDDGGLEFGPDPWLRPGFWEDYFDGLPDASADFEAAKASIINEAGLTR